MDILYDAVENSKCSKLVEIVKALIYGIDLKYHTAYLRYVIHKRSFIYHNKFSSEEMYEEGLVGAHNMNIDI